MEDSTVQLSKKLARSEDAVRGRDTIDLLHNPKILILP
jgi:hypothetical protein